MQLRSGHRRLSLLTAVLMAAGGALLGTQLPAGAAAAAPASVPAAAWGTAQRIPGVAGLAASLRGDDVHVNTVSCSAPGDCVVGGDASSPDDNYGSTQDGWVATEAAGRWTSLVPVTIGWSGWPGRYVTVNSASCASPGNCAAVGYDSQEIEPEGTVDTYGAYVIDEVSGTWGAPEQIPGTDALNQGNWATATSVSCPAPGDCAATGVVNGNLEFVADETGGAWGTAELVAGYRGGGQPFYGGASPVISCAKPGDCTVAGTDATTAGAAVTSVATETGGTWGAATPISGFAAAGGSVTALSCTAPGDCGAGGWADASSQSSDRVPFVADEVNGTWTSAEVPGYSAISKAMVSAGPEVRTVTCTAPGNCAAGGGFQTTGRLGGAFTVTESGGTWRPARAVPGIPLRVVHSSSEPYGIAVAGISCPAAGDCSAVIDDGVARASYVMDETGGTWGTAHLIAGTTRSFLVSAVSCPAVDACLASGNEVAPTDESGALEWALAKSAAATSLTSVSLARKTVAYGNEEAEKVTATVRATDPDPADKVTVTAAGQPVCTMTLKAGTGSCTVPPARFARGPVKLTVRYAGGGGFAPGTPVATSFTVAKAASATSLRLSAAHVRYGKERSEIFTVRVSPRDKGTPTAKVTLWSRGTALCTLTLKRSTGACSLSPKRLRPGSYHLVARYTGDANFNGSSSSARLLTITP